MFLIWANKIITLDMTKVKIKGIDKAFAIVDFEFWISDCRLLTANC